MLSIRKLDAFSVKVGFDLAHYDPL
jgi:hypothetical protein